MNPGRTSVWEVLDKTPLRGEVFMKEREKKNIRTPQQERSWKNKEKEKSMNKGSTERRGETESMNKGLSSFFDFGNP